MRVYVILPAAGIGTRMSSGVASGGSGPSGLAPKQFLTIGGVPILIHSLRAFLAVERVDALYVAVRGSETERVHAVQPLGIEETADFALEVEVAQFLREVLVGGNELAEA